MEDNFKVETILTGLQDLKQVRDSNEKRLAETCSKRIDLETKLESLSRLHSSAAGKKTAANESWRVAREQTSLAEAQATSMEQMCREKRENIRELNEKMEQLKREDEIALSEFTEKMIELSDQFRFSRDYYTDGNLLEEVVKYKRECEENRERVIAKRSMLEELTVKVSELEREEDGGGEVMIRNGVTRLELQTLLDIVKEEKELIMTELRNEEEKLKQHSNISQGVDTSNSSGVVMREE